MKPRAVRGLLGFALASAALLASASPARADEPRAATPTTDRASARASAPAEPRDPPGRVVLGVGPSLGQFFGLPYRTLAFDVGARVERGPIRWVGEGEFEGGRTKHGLSIFRTGVTGGIENAGRVHVGVGARLSYTMVVRATNGGFFKAFFGDIGGFGVGAQAWLAADLVKTDDLTVGLSARASGDLYNGGTATRAALLLEVGF